MAGYSCKLWQMRENGEHEAMWRKGRKKTDSQNTVLMKSWKSQKQRFRAFHNDTLPLSTVDLTDECAEQGANI